MSVAPDWRKLYSYQIPRSLRHIVPTATGPAVDRVWRFGETEFLEGIVADNLKLRSDRPQHGMIEPAATVPVAKYRADLAATRDQWIMIDG